MKRTWSNFFVVPYQKREELRGLVSRATLDSEKEATLGVVEVPTDEGSEFRVVGNAVIRGVDGKNDLGEFHRELQTLLGNGAVAVFTVFDGDDEDGDAYVYAVNKTEIHTESSESFKKRHHRSFEHLFS